MTWWKNKCNKFTVGYDTTWITWVMSSCSSVATGDSVGLGMFWIVSGHPRLYILLWVRLHQALQASTFCVCLVSLGCSVSVLLPKQKHPRTLTQSTAKTIIYHKIPNPWNSNCMTHNHRHHITMPNNSSNVNHAWLPQVTRNPNCGLSFRCQCGSVH